ncbi:MAG: efflux RND transporter periplasmic adaptor subunit [Planctomycetales bacterium]|nr:efflux RND transporter periplasmic adaptor subunit [Planctomycetales bacterium]
MSVTAATPPATPTSAVDTTPPSLAQTTHAIVSLRCADDERWLRGFRAILECFAAPFGLLQFDHHSQTVEHTGGNAREQDTAWRKLSDGLLLNARYRNHPCGQLFESGGGRRPFAVLAAPLSRAGGEAFGSISVVTACPDATTFALKLAELEALTTLLTHQGPAAPVAPTPSSTSTPASSTANVSKAAEYESLHEFAFAIVNNLKGKMNCDQVAFGWVKNKQAKVLCLSGFYHVYPRSPGVRVLEQAMSECLDAGVPICCQQDAQYSTDPLSSGHALHRMWRADVGNVPVASVPITVQGECVAILSLRNPLDRPFSKDQLQKVMELVNPLAPGLRLLARADRSVPRHLLDTTTTFTHALLSPSNRVSQITAVLLAAVIAWATFGTLPHTLTVPCETIPTDLRDISIPFSGTLDRICVRAGQFVRQGQLLASMQTSLLEADRDKELAAMRLATIEMNDAMQRNDANTAGQAQARVEMARAQLKLIETRIAASQIVSPADGVIVGDHLERRVGATVPLGESFCNVAVDGGLTLKLLIPERQIAYAETGQQVNFAVEAKPDQRAACQVDWLSESAVAADGRNVFVAECQLAESDAWLKAGMTGTARIEAGRQRIAWLWFHRLLDWLRIQTWKL